MEKFACWCIKQQADVDKTLVITACIVAGLAIVLESLVALNCSSKYLLIVGVLETLGMFVGAFLIDIGEIVHKINKEEKNEKTDSVSKESGAVGIWEKVAKICIHFDRNNFVAHLYYDPTVTDRA